jgi:hypothetical protein
LTPLLALFATTTDEVAKKAIRDANFMLLRGTIRRR